MREPRVDIILVNYNNYTDTIECVKSLMNVEYENYRILIIDNRSSNDSISRLSPYLSENIILIEAEKNGGFAYGCNIGIQKSIHDGIDYIILLNNDTEVEPGFIKEMLKPFSLNDTGIVGGKIFYYDSTKIWYCGGHYNKYTCKVKHVKKDLKEKHETEFVTGCLQMIPVKVVEKIGGLREDYFMYYEDLEYCDRIKKYGYKLICNPDAIIYHKCGGSADYKSESAQYYSNRARLMYIREQKNRFAEILLFMELCLKRMIYRDGRVQGVKRLLSEWKNPGIKLEKYYG